MQIKRHAPAEVRELLQEGGDSDGVSSCVNHARGRRTHEKNRDQGHQDPQARLNAGAADSQKRAEGVMERKKTTKRNGKQKVGDTQHRKMGTGLGLGQKDRIQSLESALITLQSKSAVTLGQASKTETSQRHMALNIRSICVLKASIFYATMNQAFSASEESKHDHEASSTNLSSYARETLRYVSLLPHRVMEDGTGRYDWSCLKFTFQEDRRAKRLAQAKGKTPLRGKDAGVEDEDEVKEDDDDADQEQSKVSACSNKEEEKCEVCCGLDSSKTNPMILCGSLSKGCGKAWHLFCIGLETIPRCNWFCAACRSPRLTCGKEVPLSPATKPTLTGKRERQDGGDRIGRTFAGEDGAGASKTHAYEDDGYEHTHTHTHTHTHKRRATYTLSTYNTHTHNIHNAHTQHTHVQA